MLSYIIPVIFGRVSNGFADIAEGAIMHNCFKRVSSETETQKIFIRQISVNKMTPLDKFPMATAQIIIDDRFVAFFVKDFIGVGPDVTSTSGDEYHIHQPSSSTLPAIKVKLLQNIFLLFVQLK